MLLELKKRLSMVILTALVLVPLMLSMSGCTTKEVMITKPVEVPRMDLTEVLADLPVMDFNKTARSEEEASLMAWDLYIYIKELELRLDKIKEMR